MKKYKKFLITSTLTFFILSFMYYFISFNFISYKKVEISDELVWIRNCLLKKHRNADIEQNKIIITSGSNTLFGMRTKDISDELSIPVYNLAIHAGLGLDFILDDAKEALKSGDVIILPLEYNLFSSNEKTTKLAFDYYQTFGKEKLGTINTIDSLKLVFEEKPYEHAKKIIKSIFNKEKQELVENPNGYNSKNLNEHGDQTMHPGQKYDLTNLTPFELPKEFTETLGLTRIKEFNIWCNQNNIKLFVTFPNTMYFKEYGNNDYKEYFIFLNEYFSNNNISTIGKPSDFFYDKKFFYDTSYHLSEEGMTIRTKEFISLIEGLPEIQTLQSKLNVNK
jgi:hypothetical protein